MRYLLLIILLLIPLGAQAQFNTVQQRAAASPTLVIDTDPAEAGVTITFTATGLASGYRVYYFDDQAGSHDYALRQIGQSTDSSSDFEVQTSLDPGDYTVRARACRLTGGACAESTTQTLEVYTNGSLTLDTPAASAELTESDPWDLDFTLSDGLNNGHSTIAGEYSTTGCAGSFTTITTSWTDDLDRTYSYDGGSIPASVDCVRVRVAQTYGSELSENNSVTTSGGSLGTPSCLYAAANTTGSATMTSSSISPTGDAMLLVIVGNRTGGGARTVDSMSDTFTGTGTWTEADEATESTAGLSIYYATLGSSPGSGTVMATFSGSPSRRGMIICEITGATSIAETNAATKTSGATHSVALADLAGGAVAFSAIVDVQDTDSDIAAGSGETELDEVDAGAGNNDIHLQVQYSTSDATANWTNLQTESTVAIVIEVQ